MMDYIITPTVGEIHVPGSRIQDILHDCRKVTADTSLRLTKFFGISQIQIYQVI